jgi:hypothetical protein
MGSRSPGGHRDRRRKAALLATLLAASERLYGTLLVVYPQAFRRRYASEMPRCGGTSGTFRGKGSRREGGGS